MPVCSRLSVHLQVNANVATRDLLQSAVCVGGPDILSIIDQSLQDRSASWEGVEAFLFAVGSVIREVRILIVLLSQTLKFVVGTSPSDGPKQRATTNSCCY